MSLKSELSSPSGSAVLMQLIPFHGKEGILKSCKQQISSNELLKAPSKALGGKRN